MSISVVTRKMLEKQHNTNIVHVLFHMRILQKTSCKAVLYKLCTRDVRVVR